MSDSHFRPSAASPTSEFSATSPSKTFSARSPTQSDFQEPYKSTIAICGFGVRLPGGIRNGHDFWDFLKKGKDARKPIPESRYNIQGFDDSLGGKEFNKVKHGYFLEDDLSVFDASFFTLAKNEVDQTDPQQRMLLEVARECLEESGEVSYRGQAIGCYVGTYGDDWVIMSAKDSQQGNGYSVTGHSDLIMANRISYEYDLRGPRYVEFTCGIWEAHKSPEELLTLSLTLF